MKLLYLGGSESSWEGYLFILRARVMGQGVWTNYSGSRRYSWGQAKIWSLKERWKSNICLVFQSIFSANYDAYNRESWPINTEKYGLMNKNVKGIKYQVRWGEARWKSGCCVQSKRASRMKKTSYPGCFCIKTVGKRCRRKTRICWEYDSRHPY